MNAITRAVAVAAATLVACSITLQERAPKRLAPGEYPKCDEKGETALADLALTIGGVALLGAALDDDNDAGPAIAAGAVTALFATSALLGATWTSTCREAREAWRPSP